jgi:hypothetical protein
LEEAYPAPGAHAADTDHLSGQVGELVALEEELAVGLGVVEAGMILGLTAAGISEADATAAVFIQRLFTSYLPPIWGWATLTWMRRREYV